MNGARFLLLSGVCLAVAGCASSLTVVKKDAAFSYDSLKSGGLAIAPVTRTDKSDYYLERSAGRVIYTQLTNNLPGVRIVPTKEYRSLLGGDSVRSINESFYELAVLPKAAFSLLSPLRENCRFVLFVNVNQDNIRDLSGVYEVTRSERVWDPAQKTFVEQLTTNEEASKGTSRSMGAILVIYDLLAQRESWRAKGIAGGAYSTSASVRDFDPKTGVPGGPEPNDLLGWISAKAARKWRSY